MNKNRIKWNGIGPWNRKYWFNLLSFGIFYSHLVSLPFGLLCGHLLIPPFWYVVPRKIWQPCWQAQRFLGSFWGLEVVSISLMDSLSLPISRTCLYTATDSVARSERERTVASITKRASLTRQIVGLYVHTLICTYLVAI
jgi:hypothetical protein